MEEQITRGEVHHLIEQERRERLAADDAIRARQSTLEASVMSLQQLLPTLETNIIARIDESERHRCDELDGLRRDLLAHEAVIRRVVAVERG